MSTVYDLAFDQLAALQDDAKAGEADTYTAEVVAVGFALLAVAEAIDKAKNR